MRKPPTRRSQQWWDEQLPPYVEAYIKEHGFSPSLREMATHFEVSVSTLHWQVDRMRRHKILEFDHNKKRTLRLPGKRA